jgi:hypothetical protein
MLPLLPLLLLQVTQELDASAATRGIYKAGSSKWDVNKPAPFNIVSAAATVAPADAAATTAAAPAFCFPNVFLLLKS